MNPNITIFLLTVIFLLSACRGKAAPQEAIEVHPELQNIPVFPEATAWMEGIPGVNQDTYKYPVYSYTVKTIQYEHIVEFYKKEMPANSWELLSISDDRKTQSAGLMFSKSKTVAHLQIYPRITGVYMVAVVFYDDPVLDEQQE